MWGDNVSTPSGELASQLHMVLLACYLWREISDECLWVLGLLICEKQLASYIKMLDSSVLDIVVG